MAARAPRRGRGRVVDGTLAAVLDFSTREQHDDITLVVARGR